MFAAGFVALLAVVQVAPTQARSGPPPTPEAVAADTGTLRHANHRTPPLVFATRMPGRETSMHIDGHLDEGIWSQARPITQFTQTAPAEGEPATERTEVRIVYDEHSIYVGARLFDSDPNGIRSQLARRDASTEADLFEVAFDSYHDHNTAFVFGVNPSGVKTDRVVGSDGFSSDDGWDAVWEASASIDAQGWTVEMRIPLSQLRFSPAAHQVWGVNFFRRIQRKAENTVFAFSKSSDRGYASFFAHLQGIERLPSSRRLELVPYAMSREERIDPHGVKTPFNDGSREVGGIGMDAKYGLTSGLTLDATINPDFGQVDADPAFVNLSAFEQFLSERRPFFIEGANIFNNFGSTAQLFYSRRIGRAPQGSADARGGFVDMPDHATIAGAGKLSGRIGKWSVGMLEATTARAFAAVDSSGQRFRDQVEPLTNYFVARGQRDWRGGADQLGFIATAVNRDINSPSLRFLRTSAYVGGIDFGHRFAGNVYSLTGSVVGSRINGDTLAIQGAQLSSARYYQQPDARTNRYDPLATSMQGWSGLLNFNKEAGDVQGGLTAAATSPGFEVNDAGFQTSADGRELYGFINRRWTKPSRLFRFAFIGNNLDYSETFDRVKTGFRYNANTNATFLNNWNADAHYTWAARVLSPNLTRGGPLALVPGFWNVNGGVGTDTRRPVSAYAGGAYARNDVAGWGVNWFSSIDIRPTKATTLSIQPGYGASDSKVQYVQTQADPTATATYGNQYVFSEVLQYSLDLTTRLSITFKPNLSLQIYTQPFVATGDYHELKELRRAGSLDYVTYGRTPGSTLECRDAKDQVVSCSLPSGIAAYIADPDGAGPRASVRVDNPDFNSRSLNGNAVLRWEYRPGSTMFFVWSTSCSTDASNPRFSAGGDMRRLCQGPSDNIFAVKANYWFSF
jgi:hypothetical protein